MENIVYMKAVFLKEVEHNRKLREPCDYIEPNIVEDCLFCVDGEIVGFYYSSLPDRIANLLNIIEHELSEGSVPYQSLVRTNGYYQYKQKSAVIGATPAKPNLGFYYQNVTSLHGADKAQKYIKAMLMLAAESEALIRDLMPAQYETQLELVQTVPERLRLSNLFTSAISNLNASIPFHIDGKNIKQTVNAIFCKRRHTIGGDLHVPGLDITIWQPDNSLIVFPVWRYIHAVTKIIKQKPSGYRNSHVFYTLKI
jgi:hypothetical protein